MSNKSRYHRTTDQGRRRRAATGTGISIAVGGAMAAAFISMGTASAVPSTDLDPFTDAATALAGNDEGGLGTEFPGGDDEGGLGTEFPGGDDEGGLGTEFPGGDDEGGLGSELTALTNADTALATSNPELASRLDVLVDQALLNGGLPVGTAGDADAFSDSGLANGPTLDAEFATLSQQLDPLVDQALGTPPPGDIDPFTDLAQAFDPHAFTGAGAPADVIGAFATELDTLVTSNPMAVALDTMADQIIAGFSTMTF